MNAIFLITLFLGSISPEDNPRELGQVHWLRDYEAALTRAGKENKPVFLLFQEIPGCSTCVGFGDSVLSHPLIVEAIENEFIPAAVHNNKGGKDGEVLRRYGEPAWNNPVVRFIGANGKDLISRKSEIWNVGGMSSRIVKALEAAGKTVPEYLQLVAQENESGPRERGVFAMYCFWEGEAKLGSLPGVVATRAVSIDSSEGVEVTFDPNRISLRQLTEKAAEMKCFHKTLNENNSEVQGSGVGDQKYYWRHSAYRFLPLTSLQVVKINSALGLEQDPKRWLSPKQIVWLNKIQQRLKTDPRALDRFTPPEVLSEWTQYAQTLEAKD